MSSPWVMAPFGHSGSHAPQLMHSSVMTVAMASPVRFRPERARRTRAPTAGKARSIYGERPGRGDTGGAFLGRPATGRALVRSRLGRGDAAVDRADAGAGRGVVRALALGALGRVDDVDVV